MRRYTNAGTFQEDAGTMDYRISRRALNRAAATALGLAGSAMGTAHAQIEGIWREIASSGPAPSARWDHTLAAHDAGKQLVLFGGRDSDGTPRSDVWTFSRTRETWTQHEVPGPSNRFGHAVTCDQDAQVMYLFGGQSADVFYNDLWSLDLGSMTWNLVHDGGGTAPSSP
jgi:hypothetical protein